MHPRKSKGVLQNKTQRTNHTLIIPLLLLIDLPDNPRPPLHRPLTRKDTPPIPLLQAALPQQGLDSREVRLIGGVFEDGDEGRGEGGGGRGEVRGVGIGGRGARFEEEEGGAGGGHLRGVEGAGGPGNRRLVGEL